MPVTEEQEQILEKYRKNPDDTGSAAVQIIELTYRIAELTGHLQTHSKDNHSRLGLLRMVGKRRRLLKYLSRSEPDVYRQLAADLSLRTSR